MALHTHISIKNWKMESKSKGCEFYLMKVKNIHTESVCRHVSYSLMCVTSCTTTASYRGVGCALLISRHGTGQGGIRS